MSVRFQTLISGSSGNSLLLAGRHTRLLVDAGFRSMRQCRQLLAEWLESLDAVVLTHLHSDHVSHWALRVFEEAGIPVFVHGPDADLLAEKHFGGRSFHHLRLVGFEDGGFHIGEFYVRPFEVPHYPGMATFGFRMSFSALGEEHHVVTASDLSDWRKVWRWFRNADLLCVEANHDPQLLALNWNPNSLYHLSNQDCGRLVRQALRKSRYLPGAVVLAHLSDERNTPELATTAVRTALETKGLTHLPLYVAPRHRPSRALVVG